MATFVYKAKKDNAETVTGQVTAQTEDEAIDIINQLGLLPVQVTAQSDDDVSKIGRPQRVPIREIYVFSRQLANLLRSGVSIIRALNIVAEQTHHKYFRKIIMRISWNIKNGMSFSEAIEEYPQIFNSLYVTMARAGEESSNLHQMLTSVSQYQKRQDEVISKVKTAMTYPILMAVVGVGTIVFIMTFVLPRMMGLFTSIGDALPLPTVILLRVSDFMTVNWLWFLLGMLGVAAIIQRWARSSKGRTSLSRFVLGLPFFGEMILKVELARFCRTLVLLQQSGVSIIKALTITIPILSNDVIKRQLLYCREYLTSGGSFGEGLKHSKSIPNMMAQLVSIGEESGNIDEVLKEIADTYEQDTNEQIKVMTTLFEPVMILVVGLVIGFIVFAMLLPIFQIDVLVG